MVPEPGFLLPGPSFSGKVSLLISDHEQRRGTMSGQRSSTSPDPPEPPDGAAGPGSNFLSRLTFWALRST